MFNFLKKTSQGQQITLKIQGMHCTSCALNIDGALEDTPGVFRAETSYARAQVVIDFDPAQISSKKLITIIAEQGYQATL